MSCARVMRGAFGVTNEALDLRPMTTDPKQLFPYPRGVHIFGRSVQCVPVSNDVRCDAEPRPSDDSNQADLAASIIRRRHYDAMLPSLNLPNRSRLRLTLDLMIGIPFLFILWRFDALRVSLDRIASLFHRAAVGDRGEKRRKKHEASE